MEANTPKIDQIVSPKAKVIFWKKATWISLGVSVILFLTAIGGAVIGIVRAFSDLSANGNADPDAIASDISFSLLTSLWSLPPALIVFIFFLISLVRWWRLTRTAVGAKISSITD